MGEQGKGRTGQAAPQDEAMEAVGHAIRWHATDGGEDTTS